MTVRYHTRRGVEIPDYQCMNRCIQDGAQRCQTIPGGIVDAAVASLLLDTLTPHALEVALTVQAELDTRAAEADALRRGHVERARHRADLARRRYLAVDPDNRLVADSLEADWNDALRALQTAREDYDRASAAATATLTDELKDRIHSLATDFPALWSNPSTAQRDRKRMVRLLVDDVTPHKTDRIHLHVRFRGGQTTSLAVAIPPKAWQVRQTHPDTLATLDRLLDTHTDAQTAAALNAAGHRSGEGKPSPVVSCSKRAAATTCPATPSGSTPKACSPKPRSPHSSACTPVPSRPGPKPESSTPTRQTTRMNGSTNHLSPVIHASPSDKAAH
jgi:hypothetical protein